MGGVKSQLYQTKLLTWGCVEVRLVFWQLITLVNSLVLNTSISAHLMLKCNSGRVLSLLYAPMSNIVFTLRIPKYFGKGCFPLKVVFHQRSSFIEGCLLSKVVFHRRSSSIEGRLPSKIIFHLRFYTIIWCALEYFILMTPVVKMSENQGWEGWSFYRKTIHRYDLAKTLIIYVEMLIRYRVIGRDCKF